MGNYLIRNQTPHELVIEGADKLSLKLAPLQRRRIGASPERLFGDAARAARRDRAVDWELEPVRSTRLLAAAWLAGAGIASCAAGVIAYSQGSGMLALWLGVGAAVACAIAGAYVIGRGRTRPDRTETSRAEPDRAEPGRVSRWLAPGWLRRWRTRRGRKGRDQAAGHRQKDSPRLDPTPLRGEQWGIVRDFFIATCQGLIMVLVLFAAVAAPASAIYYGTELSNVIVITNWSHVSLVAGHDALTVVVARLLQLVMLIIVSIVPALMYFQFDREKLSTLVDRWLHAIFRLDPSLGTVADVDAKFGRRVEEFYGASLATGVGEPRKRLHDRSPVIVATLLIAIGWIVVLLNDAHRGGALPSVQDLFRPSPTPMTMGFLGAYFLAIQVTLRGYVRGDLKPKTYNVITVRILMAVILAWAAQALWGTNQAVLALSFIAGILPNTVLRRIRDIGGPGTILRQVQGARGRQKAADSDRQKAERDDLQVQSPLSQLDEVDVYERTRLEEEGITSVQALARHDLIDLILSSRIPVPRLIDWVDQAILLQHVPERAAQTLRGLGIRTATDYLQVSADECAFNHVSSVLEKGGLNAELLRTVLNGDEWLTYIENWRRNDGTTAMQVHTYGQDGCLKKRRVKIGPAARVSAGAATAGSTTKPGQLASFTASPAGQPAQNGDGGQPAQDGQPARTAGPGTANAAA